MKKGIWFRDYLNNAVWDYTNNDSYIKLNECIQEILLWKGENSFEANRGIDYEGVLNSSRFMISQLENIIDQYKEYFRDIVVNPINITSPIVLVDINFYFFKEVEIRGTFRSGLNFKVKFAKEESKFRMHGESQ